VNSWRLLGSGSEAHLTRLGANQDLVAHDEKASIEGNTLLPHGALSWNQPLAVDTGPADPKASNVGSRTISPAT
jgi:hypothetical protein